MVCLQHYVEVKQPNVALQLLTLTPVSHLQVLVSAETGVSKHRVAGFDGTAAFPITAVDAD